MEIETLKRKLGLRLRELRRKKSLKQEDIQAFEFSSRYYGRLERGIVNPTLGTLLKLSEIFDINLSELFFFADDNPVSEESEAVSILVAGILKDGDKKKIHKLKVFLDEIL